ncbi:MAG: CBS domain-containing protein [Rhodoferax sp.]|nr:CBS domain-containing protein [Rhodoferax sp.]MCF8211478.1 CBS domain-containing protein [Rhodoferax sp.]
MFSIYGRAGRLFRGSLEEMRQLGPVTRASRSTALQPIGRDPLDQNPSHLPDTRHAALPVDLPHRSALDAYSQTTRIEMPRHPLTHVGAIMSTRVITVADTDTVEQAWQVLSSKHMGQAPVVTQDGILVGLLSRADLMRPERLPGPESHALVWRALLLQKVLDIMWTPVPCVAPETDIRRLARVLLDSGLPGLPVVDDAGLVVGFVSRSDILRAVVADPPLDLWG